MHPVTFKVLILFCLYFHFRPVDAGHFCGFIFLDIKQILVKAKVA